MTRFNLSTWAVKERSLTLFLILAIAGAGVLAFLKLGRAEDPPFTVKVLTVSASWPGATAQEMQDLVADPIEKCVQELRWYDHVDTFTRRGQVFMTIVLRGNTPPDQVQEQFYQARKKIGDESRNLPDGARPPIVYDEYSGNSLARTPACHRTPWLNNAAGRAVFGS